MQRIIESEKLEILYAKYETKPRVFYKNLYRFFKCFIGGNVAYKIAGQDECVEGARVALIKNSKKIDEVLTDKYGDFRFDHLEENSGEYGVEIIYDGYDKRIIEVDLKTSINVGTIFL